MAIDIDADQYPQTAVTPSDALLNVDVFDNRLSLPRGIPSVVLEEVVDILLQERPSFDYATIGLDPVPIAECEKTLMDMSLVHRTWRVYAQRALAVRIHIRGTKGVRAALASPFVGGRTREVAFKWRKGPNTEDGTYSAIEQSETALLELALLLQRLVGLRLLAIATYNCEGDPSLDNVLASIGGSTTLNGLWLVNKFDEHGDPGLPCGHLDELFRILPLLNQLRFLSVKGWEVGYRWDYSGAVRRAYLPSAPDHSLSPCRSLKQVSIAFDKESQFPPAFAEWLFRPRGEYSLERVSVHLWTWFRDQGIEIEDPEDEDYCPSSENAYVHNAIIKWLGDVKTVHFRVDKVDIIYPIFDIRDYLTFGSTLLSTPTKFHSVRDLRLQVTGCPTRTPIREIYLPASVEELHVRYGFDKGQDDLPEVYECLDKALESLLTRNALPRLWRFTLTCDDASNTIGAGTFRSAATDERLDSKCRNEDLLPRTKHTCATTGIEFCYSEDIFAFHVFMME